MVYYGALASRNWVHTFDTGANPEEICQDPNNLLLTQCPRQTAQVAEVCVQDSVLEH